MDKERLEVIKEMFIMQNMKSLNGYGTFKLDDILWLINKVEGYLNKEKKDSEISPIPTLEELMSNTHHIPTLEELMSRVTPFNQHEEVGFDKPDVLVKIKRLWRDAFVPNCDNATSFDLIAISDVTIRPGETNIMPTGLSVELPSGYELQIRPLPDVIYKTKLRVQPCHYQSGEEIFLVVDNIAPLYLADGCGPALKGAAYLLDGSKITDEDYIHGTYIIKKGDKIAKGVIVPTVKADFVFMEE